MLGGCGGLITEQSVMDMDVNLILVLKWTEIGCSSLRFTYYLRGCTTSGMKCLLLRSAKQILEITGRVKDELYRLVIEFPWVFARCVIELLAYAGHLVHALRMGRAIGWSHLSSRCKPVDGTQPTSCYQTAGRSLSAVDPPSHTSSCLQMGLHKCSFHSYKRRKMHRQTTCILTFTCFRMALSTSSLTETPSSTTTIPTRCSRRSRPSLANPATTRPLDLRSCFHCWLRRITVSRKSWSVGVLSSGHSELRGEISHVRRLVVECRFGILTLLGRWRPCLTPGAWVTWSFYPRDRCSLSTVLKKVIILLLSCNQIINEPTTFR